MAIVILIGNPERESQAMKVRSFREDDAAALAQIFFSAIHEIARAHYGEEQVHAWAPVMPAPERFVARGTDGRTLLVAVDEADVPIAYGDLEADGHIDHLFCRPDHAGKGVALAVYEELELVAQKQGIERLYVEASEPASRFFRRREFEIEGRNDFELNGVPIHNYRMAKQLG
jgi:putative acetyltransferase